MSKNRGVITPEVKLSDYVAGEETGIKYQEVLPSGDWTLHQPTRESQYLNGFDTSACVTYSALNCIEFQLNFLLSAGLISESNVQKLKVWGYITNERFNFSDRFTAKMSSTTPLGNTLQKVWDSIRKDGLVPEQNWSSQSVNFADYYKEIPQQVKDFGKNILTMFNFKYEWIVTSNCGASNLNYLKYHLKQAPLQPAHPLCVRDDNNVFQPCGACITQHATTIYHIDDLIRNFDHYEPYTNKYALNYAFPWIMKGVVTIKEDQPEEPPFNHKFTVDMKYGQTSEEIKFLQKAYNILGYSVPVTGFFGNQTQAITLDFWKKYKTASLWEIMFLKGKVVGPKTRYKLNELLS